MKTEDYIKGIQSGNISTLAKAITLIESSLDKDKIKGEQLIEKCTSLSNKTIRIGISGTPGVGKSTFIESLGMQLVEKNIKVAILAIDPSSTLSKGSILGDKTRMEKLSNSTLAFIRPSPNSGVLGGVSNNTKKAITICEVAKFDVIIIETVGVGQSEAIVESMTDFFIYLTLVHNGDQLQFIKKGVLELSDIILINKSDQNQAKTKKMILMLKNSMKNNAQKQGQSVFACSALTGFNIQKIWRHIVLSYQEKDKNGEIQKKREQQDFFWFKKILEEELKDLLFKNIDIKKILCDYKKKALNNPRKIALEIIKKNLKKI